MMNAVLGSINIFLHYPRIRIFYFSLITLSPLVGHPYFCLFAVFKLYSSRLILSLTPRDILTLSYSYRLVSLFYSFVDTDWVLFSSVFFRRTGSQPQFSSGEPTYPSPSRSISWHWNAIVFTPPLNYSFEFSSSSSFFGFHGISSSFCVTIDWIWFHEYYVFLFSFFLSPPPLSLFLLNFFLHLFLVAAQAAAIRVLHALLRYGDPNERLDGHEFDASGENPPRVCWL